MFQYRITKFDPQLRSPTGAFTADDWVGVGDIGARFDGAVLTTADYLRVENAYVSTAIAFLSESGVSSLTIDSLENSRGFHASATPLTCGQACDLLAIADISRLNLRSTIWCRLASEDAFLHFGYDYYMYVGVPSACPVAMQHATSSGLFVEVFDSPYLEP